MLRKGRIVAAALAGVGAAGFFVMVVVPGAGGKSSQTTVTLQLAPRGLGSVSANPPGLDSDNQPVSECTRNYAQHACEWRYARGTAVTLTAKPDAAAGRSLASWSTADCPGKGACRVVLDDDLTSVVALMTPLRLAVRLSNAEAGSVRMDPAGADCRGTLQDPAPNVCREFPARTRVTLTVQPTSPHTFKAWSSSCSPVGPGSCAITVLDQATWVGVSFDDDGLPVLPTTIKVEFRLGKRGTGAAG
jgi:Divergent InlB B-repeat domain